MKTRNGQTIAIALVLAFAAWFSLRASGQVGSGLAERVNVTVPATYIQDRIVLLAGEQMTADVLQDRVRTLMENAAQKNVILNADRSISVGEVVELMNLLKMSGADQVALTSN